MKRSEWCLRWTAAALAALALSGCGGGDSTLAPAAGTYAVTSNLAQPVAFKNATGQTTPPYQNTIGYGSAAFHDPKDAPNVLYTASDRGPNIDCEDVADPPIGIAGFCGSLEGKIFPVPGFAPSIYQIALQEQGGQRVATVLKTIRLVDKSGHPVTGLSNDFPKRPKDLNKTAASDKSVSNTEESWSADLQPIAFNQNGLDTEGLVRLPDGSFWLAEEYAPSLVHVSATGQVVERVVPADSGVLNPITGQGMSVCDALKNGTANAAAANYPINCALPGILDLRALNRGIENLAVSPDGKTLYFALQSPLANPSKDAYKVSRNVRLLTASLNADGSFGKVTGEYVYVLDLPSAFPADNSTKQNDVKLSEMTVTPGGKLIQLERISKVTKLYQVDFAKATNILGSAWDSRATQPSLTQQADLPAAGIVPVAKTLVFDTSTDDPAAMSPGKVEGVALLDGDNIALVTDNDFGIVSPQTYFYVVPKAQQLGK